MSGADVNPVFIQVKDPSHFFKVDKEKKMLQDTVCNRLNDPYASEEGPADVFLLLVIKQDVFYPEGNVVLEELLKKMHVSFQTRGLNLTALVLTNNYNASLNTTKTVQMDSWTLHFKNLRSGDLDGVGVMAHLKWLVTDLDLGVLFIDADRVSITDVLLTSVSLELMDPFLGTRPSATDAVLVLMRSQSSEQEAYLLQLLQPPFQPSLIDPGLMLMWPTQTSMSILNFVVKKDPTAQFFAFNMACNNPQVFSGVSPKINLLDPLNTDSASSVGNNFYFCPAVSCIHPA